MILTRETILNPLDHQVKIEAWIEDSAKMLSKNFYGSYEFSFQPLTADDHQRLFEAGETAYTDAVLNTPTYSSGTLRKCYENKKGQPYCSQLFEPVLNEEVINPLQISGRQATLTLHFRDGSDGNIYLQCDYCDLYDQTNGFIDYRYAPLPGEEVDETDW
jgi:hypothetical protein